MKKILLAVGMCSVLSISLIFPFSVEKKRTKQFFANYFISIVLSGCIGALTGEVIRCIEKELAIEKSPIALFLFVLSWSLESGLRNAFVGALQKDFGGYSSGHEKHLMFRTAQLASWIMYLREHIQNNGKTLNFEKYYQSLRAIV